MEAGSPICSCCLTRLEPPTKPMAVFWRRAERSWSIDGLIACFFKNFIMGQKLIETHGFVFFLSFFLSFFFFGGY